MSEKDHIPKNRALRIGFLPFISARKVLCDRSEELCILFSWKMRKGSKANYQFTVNLLVMIRLTAILNHEPVNSNYFQQDLGMITFLC